MPRLFIGIPMPENYMQRLEMLVDRLAGQLQSKIRWVAPRNAHLTLKFLGDAQAESVMDIRRALRTVDFPCFRIRVEGCGCFPNVRKPRVLWAGITTGAEECVSLAGLVDGKMTALGFEPEARPFRAHLTLGRIRQAAQDDWPGVLMDSSEPWMEHEVRHFTLWESRLKPSGAVHSVVEEFSLRGSEG